MGDKYIIELEDKPFHKEDGDFLYRAKGFNSLVFDMTGIGMLTPYTEPDLEREKKTAHDDGYSEGYQAGREDLNRVVSNIEQVRLEAEQLGMILAWDAARKIGNMTHEETEKVFGYIEWLIIENYTASEAIEKLKAYEQEHDAEIKVGDEVRFKNTGSKFVVTRIFASEEGRKCEGLFDDGEVYESVLDVVEKTGRHFPEIATILEKMRSST